MDVASAVPRYSVTQMGSVPAPLRSVSLRPSLAEAAAWIMDADDRTADRADALAAGFTFVDICAALGFDPAFLRARL